MRCFSDCFGLCSGKEKIAKRSDSRKLSVDQKTFLSQKSKVLQYNNTTLKHTFTAASPFRPKRHETTNENINDFRLDDSPDSKIKKENEKLSPSRKVLTKQRYSSIDFNVLQFLKQQDKINNKKTINNVHWEKRDKFKCFFCGGAKCKHENYLNNKNNAIEGLHSNYITTNIIASQRPSTILIKNFDLVNKFKELNIGLIVNVQREGEHPYCGPNKKLEDSGFSYNPHAFTGDDIKCRVSGWKDMSVPESVNFMIDIVKEMCVTILEDNKKVKNNNKF